MFYIIFQVELPKTWGLFSFLLACYHGHMECVSLLLEDDCDVNHHVYTGEWENLFLFVCLI